MSYLSTKNGTIFCVFGCCISQKFKCINNYTYTYNYPYIQKGFRNVFILKDNYFQDAFNQNRIEWNLEINM